MGTSMSKCIPISYLFHFSEYILHVPSMYACLGSGTHALITNSTFYFSHWIECLIKRNSVLLMLEYYGRRVVVQDKKALLKEGIDQHHKFLFKIFCPIQFELDLPLLIKLLPHL